MIMQKFLDDDGYPSEEVLTKIKQWRHENHEDLLAWFAFIKPIWYYGWSERIKPHDIFPDKYDVKEYKIFTYGWSGNEDLVRAMEQNENLCWDFTWVQSRRGGHYIFEVRIPKTPEVENG